MTDQRQRFCEEYINLNFSNASEAAKKAGYVDGPGIYVTASKLLKEPEIKQYLDKRIKELLSETDRLTLEWLRNAKRIMNSDMRNYADWGEHGFSLKDKDELSDDEAYAIQEVSETVSKYGSSQRIKLESKTQALALIGKYLSILDNNIPPREPDEMKDEKARRERIAYLLKKRDEQEDAAD